MAPAFSRMSAPLGLALLSSQVLPVSADLPVHCLVHDFVGTWKFDRYKKGKNVPDNLFTALGQDKFCYHEAPNQNAENLIVRISSATMKRRIKMRRI
jgi:hypothetical protein